MIAGRNTSASTSIARFSSSLVGTGRLKSRSDFSQDCSRFSMSMSTNVFSCSMLGCLLCRPLLFSAVYLKSSYHLSSSQCVSNSFRGLEGSQNMRMVTNMSLSAEGYRTMAASVRAWSHSWSSWRSPSLRHTSLYDSHMTGSP